ncbi:helix-turn-helix domain-containing protein [Micromonospora sp. DT4]|uniref:helix-turn-helix domain-containing protein n=1 Tax=Micromonospora sp. DT4 TaxID=3393438 RepID=UPI003CFB69D9
MRDVLYLEQIEQAEVLLKPQRVEVLRQLAEPRTCTEVAARLDQTPQRVYYHGYAAKIVDLEPGRRMSVDWGPPGVTSWELAESGGRTTLTFVQSGFDDTNPPYAAWSGSVAGLSELRRFHEMPAWQPIWVDVEVPGLEPQPTV